MRPEKQSTMTWALPRRRGFRALPRNKQNNFPRTREFSVSSSERCWWGFCFLEFKTLVSPNIVLNWWEATSYYHVLSEKSYLGLSKFILDVRWPVSMILGGFLQFKVALSTSSIQNECLGKNSLRLVTQKPNLLGHRSLASLQCFDKSSHDQNFEHPLRRYEKSPNEKSPMVEKSY